MNALVEPSFVVTENLAARLIRRPERFPSNPGVHRQPRIHLPRVLDVRADVVLAPVVCVHVVLPELVRLTQQIITKSDAGIGRVELKFTGCDRAVLQIHVRMNEVCSKTDLVSSAHDADVI